MPEHVCPVQAGAGGLTDAAWCFDTFSEVLAGLPPITGEADVLCPELLLLEDGPASFGGPMAEQVSAWQA